MKKILTKILSKNQQYKHFLNYLTGDFIVKGLAFLTIPIFTRILTTDEYGTYSLFNTSVQIMITLLGLGISTGIGRYYFEKIEDFGSVVWSNLLFVLIYMLFPVTLIIIYFHEFIPLPFDLTIYLLVAAYFGVTFDFYKKYLLSAKNSSLYSKALIKHNLIVYVLGVILLLIMHDNKYYGLIYSTTLAFVSLGIFSIYKLLHICKDNNIFKKKHIVYTLKYSVPLLPAILSNFILVQFDRYAILHLTDNMSYVGIYSFAYNIGMILNVIIIAITNSWRPYFFEKFNTTEHSKIGDIIIKNTNIVLLAALSFILFNRELVVIMAEENYLDAINIIPIIILSYVFMYLYTIYFQYSSYAKKTILISMNACIAGFSNIVLNYIFIPRFGYMAAAYTTLASYMLLFLLHYITAYIIYKDKIIKIKNIFLSLLFLVILITIFFICNIFLNNYFIMLGIKIILLLISAIYYFKLYEKFRYLIYKNH